MPLTVGQLTARLNLDRSGYTTGLAAAKGEASKAGAAIADGIKSGTDRIPGLMSTAASGAIAQMDRLASEGRRAATILQGPPQQLATLARASGLSVEELRAQLMAAETSARNLGVTLETTGQRGNMSLRNLVSTAKTVAPSLAVGAILSKGFNRLESIDSAQAKLKGLGHDAGEVQTIMADALASVKGTAFGLDEAASVAATAVAANIRPGQELVSTLKLIADTAAVAGTDMGTMGSIFNKVAANGTLTTEVMQQLQDQGIPVRVKLAEHYKVTNAEAQKMVTEGKVSFQDFSAVMQETLGGSALAMGDTIKGTLDNTGAALSRFGAGVLQPFVPLLKDSADAVIVLSDGFGTLPAPVRDGTLALGAFLALQKIGLFSGLASGAGTFVTQLRLIKTEGLAASGAVAAVGKVGGLLLLTQAASTAFLTFQKLNGEVGKVPGIMDDATQSIAANALETAKAALAPYVKELSDAGLTVDEVASAMVQGGQKAADYSKKIGDAQSYLGGVADRASIWANTLSFGLIPESDAVEAQRVIADTGQSVDEFYANLREQHLLAKNVVVDGFGAMNVVSQQYLRSVGLIPGPTIEMADAFARASAQAASNEAAYARYVASLNGAIVVTGSASSAMGQWIRAQQQAANAARDLASAQDQANVAQNRATVDLVGAQQDAAKAMRDTQSEAKKSGDAIFDSAGHFNLAQQSVRDMVGSLSTYKDAAERSITATYQQVKASDGTVAAQQAAQSAAYAARQGFIDMATSIWGVSIPAAQSIANQLGFLQGIRIDDKTFTVTMVRRTVDVAVAQSALGDSWMREINHQAEAQAAAASDAFKPPSLGDLVSAIPPPKEPKAKKGGSGKSDAQKAAEEAKRLAEEAARKELARQESMAKAVSGTLDQIGRAAQKPFDLAQMNLDGIVSQMAKSERSLANAVANGLDPKRVKPLQDQLLGLAREAGKQFQSIQLKIGTKDMAGLRSALTGTVSDVRSAVKTLQDDLRSVGAPSGVIAAITAKEDQLTAAMSEREDVVKRLGDAQTSLNNILGQYDQRVQQVTSSMQAYASLTNLVSGTEMDGFGADSLIASMKIRATEGKDFQAGLAKLKAAGLNETTWQQLLDAGPGQAANQVTALVNATSSQIQQINSLATQVFGTGRSLGTLSADSMYRTGIDAAQSVVDGLISQQESLANTIEHLADGVEVLAKSSMKVQGQRAMDGLIEGVTSKTGALNKTMSGIGAGMLSTFKTSLGIHSPSKVMAEQVGVPIIDGIIAGMNSRSSALDSTGIAITGNLAGGSTSARAGAIAGAQGPIDLQATIRFEGIDGPMAELFSKTARVEIKSANEAVQVRVNQGADPWQR